MNILITGGAGFVGSNLTKLALAQGHHVTVLDDLSTGFADNLDGLNVKFLQASITDSDAAAQACAGQDSIVHLAALGSVPRSLKAPRRSHEVNASGTLEILEAARAAGVKHVVYSSSSSVYGKNPALPKNEREWTRPMSPYAVTKLAAEQYTLAYQQSYGMETLAFRFFNIYGPGQRPGHAYAAVIPVFLECLFSGKPLPVNGSGEQSRDFTYIGSACSVLLDACERRVTHDEPVNLAFGTNTTILDLAQRLEAVTGKQAARAHQSPRTGDVPHSQADNTVLRSLFPDAAPEPMTRGLEETWKWLSGWLSTSNSYQS